MACRERGLTPPFPASRPTRTHPEVFEAIYLCVCEYCVYGYDTCCVCMLFFFIYCFCFFFNPAPTTRDGPKPFALDASDKVTQEGSLYRTRLFYFFPWLGFFFNMDERPGQEMMLRIGIGLFYSCRLWNHGCRVQWCSLLERTYRFSCDLPIGRCGRGPACDAAQYALWPDHRSVDGSKISHRSAMECHLGTILRPRTTSQPRLCGYARARLCARNRDHCSATTMKF